MVRLADTHESLRVHLEALECLGYDTEPWVDGPPLNKRRVAIVSTAGLQVRGDRPFTLGGESTAFGLGDYRVIPGDTPAGDIVMSHVSTNFDRSGFQQDINVAFPIDRLRELAAADAIGSVADFHYAFMGVIAGANGASRSGARGHSHERQSRCGVARPDMTVLHARRRRAGTRIRKSGDSDDANFTHS